MSQSNGLNIVFGAGGGLGSAVVRALAGSGKPVRGVNRSGRAEVPDGVELVAADAADEQSARAACEGASAVFHCVGIPYTEWADKFAAITDGIIEGAASAGAKLIFGDNLYMYGPVDGPMTEESPNAATGTKGRIRIAMATAIMKAHKDGRIRAAIGRASDFFGPGCFNAMLGPRVIGPALRGERCDLPGRLDVPHTYSFIDDIARSLVTLSEREDAMGGIWHLPSAETVTTGRMIEMIYEECGHPPTVRTAPRFVFSMMGLFNPMMRELKEVLYQFERPFVVDHSKFERAFGARTTPHREAVKLTVDWFRSRLES